MNVQELAEKLERLDACDEGIAYILICESVEEAYRHARFDFLLWLADILDFELAMRKTAVDLMHTMEVTSNFYAYKYFNDELSELIQKVIAPDFNLTRDAIQETIVDYIHAHNYEENPMYNALLALTYLDAKNSCYTVFNNLLNFMCGYLAGVKIHPAIWIQESFNLATNSLRSHMPLAEILERLEKR